MSELPHLTVAAVVEHDGRFLMVEEESDGRTVLNQPAGHVEVDEDLLAAAVRETREETGLHLHPEALLGIYRWRSPLNGVCYVRIAVVGRCDGGEPAPRDPDILRACWMPRSAIAADPARLRSPLVLRCLDDYLAGRRFPLDLLVDMGGLKAAPHAPI